MKKNKQAVNSEITPWDSFCIKENIHKQAIKIIVNFH